MTDGQRQPSAPDSYYPWFDWLRFVLANVVMLVHFGIIRGWSHAGDFAVQAFFALSGWLIGGLLLEQSRSDLPRFFFNRARDLGTVLPRAAVPGLGQPAARTGDREVAGDRFYKGTFVYNLFGTRQLADHVKEMPLAGTGSHFWSVNAEEQFYLLAPLLLVVAAPRFGRNPITWAALALCAYAFDIYASIVFGVLAATLHRRFPDFHLRPLARIASLLSSSQQRPGCSPTMPTATQRPGRRSRSCCCWRFGARSTQGEPWPAGFPIRCT
jgi:peptidoglycan/LPS O-acetylase OafA/YrhL